MKKVYIAPNAEITILAPRETIAAGWKSEQATGSDRWWFGEKNYFGEEITSGTTYWYDFGTSEIDS